MNYTKPLIFLLCILVVASLPSCMAQFDHISPDFNIAPTPTILNTPNPTPSITISPTPEASTDATPTTAATDSPTQRPITKPTDISTEQPTPTATPAAPEFSIIVIIILMIICGLGIVLTIYGLRGGTGKR